MTYVVEVENVKCGGCASTICDRLQTLDSVNGVEVDIAGGRVEIDGDESQRAEVVQALRGIGYPEVGSG
jgi:copper chaperone